MKINWKLYVRDVVAVYTLTFVGGFLLGFVGIPSAEHMRHYTLMTAFVIILGLTGIGCTINYGLDRLKYLALVTLGIWIGSSSNILLGMYSSEIWIHEFKALMIYFGISWVFSWAILWLVASPATESVEVQHSAINERKPDEST